MNFKKLIESKNNFTLLVREHEQLNADEILAQYSVQDRQYPNLYYHIIAYTDGDFECGCQEFQLLGLECKHLETLRQQKKALIQTISKFLKKFKEEIKFPKKNRVFKINRYLKVKFEDNRTNVYVNNHQFTQCMYLLLSVNPKDQKHKLINDTIDSIDEAKQYLSEAMHGRRAESFSIDPETEFWGHCSNLQAWADNDYDTRILAQNIAFPLLTELAEVGDPVAKRVLKDEIVKRVEYGWRGTIQYLESQGYFSSKYFTQEELITLKEIKKNAIVRYDEEHANHGYY